MARAYHAVVWIWYRCGIVGYGTKAQGIARLRRQPARDRGIRHGRRLDGDARRDGRGGREAGPDLVRGHRQREIRDLRLPRRDPSVPSIGGVPAGASGRLPRPQAGQVRRPVRLAPDRLPGQAHAPFDRVPWPRPARVLFQVEGRAAEQVRRQLGAGAARMGGGQEVRQAHRLRRGAGRRPSRAQIQGRSQVRLRVPASRVGLGSREVQGRHPRGRNRCATQERVLLLHGRKAP